MQMNPYDAIARVRCALLHPQPGVYAEIRWMPIVELQHMPINKLERYRFPANAALNRAEHRPAGDVLSADVFDELVGFFRNAYLALHDDRTTP